MAADHKRKKNLVPLETIYVKTYCKIKFETLELFSFVCDHNVSNKVSFDNIVSIPSSLTESHLHKVARGKLLCTAFAGSPYTRNEATKLLYKAEEHSPCYKERALHVLQFRDIFAKLYNIF